MPLFACDQHQDVHDDIKYCFIVLGECLFTENVIFRDGKCLTSSPTWTLAGCHGFAQKLRQ